MDGWCQSLLGTGQAKCRQSCKIHAKVSRWIPVAVAKILSESWFVCPWRPSPSGTCHGRLVGYLSRPCRWWAGRCVGVALPLPLTNKRPRFRATWRGSKWCGWVAPAGEPACRSLVVSQLPARPGATAVWSDASFSSCSEGRSRTQHSLDRSCCVARSPALCTSDKRHVRWSQAQRGAA